MTASQSLKTNAETLSKRAYQYPWTVEGSGIQKLCKKDATYLLSAKRIYLMMKLSCLHAEVEIG